MAIIDVLLAELEQESLTTRRVLERVPQAHLSWKPHPKSMSLGQLALHVATVPGNVAELAAMDTIPGPPAFVQQEAASAAELGPALTASAAKARRHLGAFDDAAMGATWRLMSGGREVMAMPRAAFARAIMLNHWYHHRGQLMVYLRLLDVPVPSVYGPSADENPFAAMLVNYDGINVHLAQRVGAPLDISVTLLVQASPDQSAPPCSSPDAIEWMAAARSALVMGSKASSRSEVVSEAA
jgi:uncharacterized damage-inducible protein DinB